jgi:hypothetical protein
MSEDVHPNDSGEPLSRRHFLMAAGLAAAGLAPAPAGATHLSGTWNVRIEWNDRRPQDVLWTLRENGTFYSSDGFSGVWIRSGDLVLLAVKSGGSPAFAGNLAGAAIDWGIALQPNGYKGTWTARQRP